jgi:7-carboxy-7-deazaguanine synthase
MRTNRHIVDDGSKLPLVEKFFSIQGEGFHTGEAAFFIRLGGCDVGCNWCDSRFSWNPDDFPLIETRTIIDYAVSSGARSVVVTGGEPLMWNLDKLCYGLRENNLRTFIETSGTFPLSGEWDWICLSPKKKIKPLTSILKKADELKVIVEDTDDFTWAESNRKKVRKNCLLYLQPEWSRFDIIIPEIVDYVKGHPGWKISLQVHKYMHIP